MPAKSDLVYELPKHTSVKKVEKDANSLLRLSKKEMQAILKKSGAPASAAKAVAKSKIRVAHKGAGFGAETVLLAVSLAPLVKSLTPILVPFSKSAAKVAEKIALDIWEMLKEKLWKKKHLELKEARKRSAPADKKHKTKN
jgi:hypothetical protein